MIIKIPKRIYIKCKKFSENRLSSSKSTYSYRGESRECKMLDDVRIGCIGEWAVSIYLTDMGFECSEPDMNIYEKNKKSFDADLYVDDIHIHVKSQGIESAKRYGNSWLFQRSDSLVSNPDDNEIIAFTNVDLENRTVEILGFCWARDMKYGECKVWSYRHTKLAVYLPEIRDRLVEF